MLLLSQCSTESYKSHYNLHMSHLFHQLETCNKFRFPFFEVTPFFKGRPYPSPFNTKDYQQDSYQQETAKTLCHLSLKVNQYFCMTLTGAGIILLLVFIEGDNGCN